MDSEAWNSFSTIFLFIKRAFSLVEMWFIFLLFFFFFLTSNIWQNQNTLLYLLLVFNHNANHWQNGCCNTEILTLIFHSFSWRGDRNYFVLGKQSCPEDFLKIFQFSMLPLQSLAASLFLSENSALGWVEGMSVPQPYHRKSGTGHQPSPRILCFWHLSPCILFPLLIAPHFLSLFLRHRSRLNSGRAPLYKYKVTAWRAPVWDSAHAGWGLL